MGNIKNLGTKERAYAIKKTNYSNKILQQGAFLAAYTGTHDRTGL